MVSTCYLSTLAFPPSLTFQSSCPLLPSLASLLLLLLAPLPPLLPSYLSLPPQLLLLAAPLPSLLLPAVQELLLLSSSSLLPNCLSSPLLGPLPLPSLALTACFAALLATLLDTRSLLLLAASCFLVRRVLILLLLVSTSCRKQEQEPGEPSIYTVSTPSPRPSSPSSSCSPLPLLLLLPTLILLLPCPLLPLISWLLMVLLSYCFYGVRHSVLAYKEKGVGQLLT